MFTPVELDGFIVGVDTPFSPLYLAYGQADGGENAVYLYLGKPLAR